MVGAKLILVPNACPMEINRLSQLRGRAYENMLAIATCNYPALHRGSALNSILRFPREGKSQLQTE